VNESVVAARIAVQMHGYIIANHGLYTWGRTMADTLRHIEAFEYLFACTLQSGG